MKLWPRKPFLLIFLPLVCCWCKHASHSERLTFNPCLHHYLDIWGGESDRIWNSAGEEAAVWEEQERQCALYACIFQSNKRVDFLIHHYPCFKFPREDTNSWEEPVRHGSTTWHTQHGSMQQRQARLLSRWPAKSPASAGVQWAVQVLHWPAEGKGRL